jgi:hypothetical protein
METEVIHRAMSSMQQSIVSLEQQTDLAKQMVHVILMEQTPT